MNKNQIGNEDAVDTSTEKNETDTTAEQTSHNSKLNDLYNDLLITLNTPASNKNSETKEKESENKSSKENAEASLRNAKFSDLVNLIDTQNKKSDSPQSFQRSDTDINKAKPEKPDKPESGSSFRDDILNSEIFDSVVKDLNKQKEEMAEKKKERDRDSKLKNISDTANISGEIEKLKKVAEANEQENVKIYTPPAFAKAAEKDEKKDEKDEKDGKTETDNISKFDIIENLENQDEEVQKSGISIKEEMDFEEQDDDDILKALGVAPKYEPETENILDSGKVISIKKKAAKSSKLKLKSIHQVLNGEYVSPEQNSAVFAGYKKIYISECIKFIASVACLIILLYMELSPYLKLPLPYFIDPNYYTSAYILIDLQILLIVAWLNADSLIFGVKSIFAASVNIYYISVFFLITTFFHTIATYFWSTPLEDSTSPDTILFNSITIFGLVLVSLYNLLDINIEIMGFKVISSKKSKYGVRLNNKSILEMEEFRDIIPANTIVGNILKTDFISNFFARTNRKKIYATYERLFFILSLCMSAFLFALLLGFKTDRYIALTSAVTVMLSSIPFCSVIVNIFPVYKAQKKAYAMGSAIIGAKSTDDYSEVSILSVYDKDIFPPEQAKMSNFRILGKNDRLETVLQHFCAVFEKLNMAVAENFKVTTLTTYETNFNKHVDILSIAENGVCFTSNGRKLFMGNIEYISNIGLAVNHDRNFDEQFQKSSGSILFLSSDSEVIAKLYIKYEIIPEFFEIIKSLAKANICLGIRTFDPNIDSALLGKFINSRKFPIKVVKLKDLNEVYQIPDSMDSGIVSKVSLKSLARTLLLCNKTKNIRKSNILIQMIAFIAGIGITSAIIIAGIINGDIWTINPGYILLFHIFWLFPILFFSALTPN